MGWRVPYDRWGLGIVAIMCLLEGSVYAGDSNDKKPDDATIKEVLDCRYRQASENSEGKATNEMFPSDNLFRPLLADPKQPQWFALWQSTQSRLERTSANIGTVGIGENFGFYTRRKGCNGWQISLLTGIFAQFDLDTYNTALINVDFNVGVPLTCWVGVAGRSIALRARRRLPSLRRQKLPRRLCRGPCTGTCCGVPSTHPGATRDTDR